MFGVLLRDVSKWTTHWLLQPVFNDRSRTCGCKLSIFGCLHRLAWEYPWCKGFKFAGTLFSISQQPYLEHLSHLIRLEILHALLYAVMAYEANSGLTEGEHNFSYRIFWARIATERTSQSIMVLFPHFIAAICASQHNYVKSTMSIWLNSESEYDQPLPVATRDRIITDHKKHSS